MNEVDKFELYKKMTPKEILFYESLIKPFEKPFRATKTEDMKIEYVYQSINNLTGPVWHYFQPNIIKPVDKINYHNQFIKLQESLKKISKPKITYQIICIKKYRKVETYEQSR